MQLTPLCAISPLDGRYSHATKQLRTIVSEYALIYYRLTIEIQWLILLATHLPHHQELALTTDEQHFLENIIAEFNETDAEEIKRIEDTTKHDVKAVEYFLRDKCEAHATLKRLCPYIHFACTSEDINNLAYGMMVQKLRDEHLLPLLQKIIDDLTTFAKKTAEIPMLSRTHGQAATPTTLGKEFKNVAMRLATHTQYWKQIPIVGKCNGAVGNYNAHVVAFPDVDWEALSQTFVESLHLQWNSHTTQIEPHDFLAQYLNALNVIHTILIDCARDCWGYIALSYFTQKKSDSEVGSSTMPHKINPIDFENAEGNLGLAIALSTHLSQKLPVSRWQRDLSDSTVLRNLGTIGGYALVAYQSLNKGFSKLIPNEAVMLAELEQHWEILAEPIQIVMRKYGMMDAYEQLKKITRGNSVTQKDLAEFIDALAIPEAAKNELKALTPSNYLGLAAKLAR